MSDTVNLLAFGTDVIGSADTGGSGSGGHVIEDTNGTALTQRADLQFVGVYTEDDSANDRTKVNVVRTMTKAQMDALSAAEKVGFIRTSDEADNPYQSNSWHTLETATGSTAVSLPSDWNELQMDVYYSNVHVPLYFNRAWLETQNVVRSGYYMNSTYNAAVSVTINTTTATLNLLYQNNADHLSEGKLKILWR